VPKIVLRVGFISLLGRSVLSRCILEASCNTLMSDLSIDEVDRPLWHLCHALSPTACFGTDSLKCMQLTWLIQNKARLLHTLSPMLVAGHLV